MNKSLRWKLLAIVGVIALCVWMIYPPSQTVRLGLDLKGGVHLVLRVQTDDALRVETQTEMERLREELQNRKIPTTNMTVASPTQFRVEGVPTDQDAAFRQAAQEIATNFDRGSGVNGAYTFT